MKFRPNRFQLFILKYLWYFLIVLKARQLGITTFFAIYYLDCVLFNVNKTAVIIAHKQTDAKRIFKRVKFAFENLPGWLKDELEIKTDSQEELSFTNGSTYFVSTSTRSGTVQYLHISEFDYVCQKFPDKAEEIVTGAINSVDEGCMCSIESTSRGSQGYFHDFFMDALRAQQQGNKLSKQQYKPFFFPWYDDPLYRDTGTTPITQQTRSYFDELFVKYNIKCDEAQMRWYQIKKDKMRDKMMQEYPSHPDEAFFASTEGAYYKTQLLNMRKDKRIRNVPYDENLYVDTYWDLGRNDENVILFVQQVGNEIRIIDEYSNNHEGLKHYVDVLREKGYTYGSHYLPHDVEVTELSTNTSRFDFLTSIGLNPIIVVPKLGIEEGIDMTRRIFSRMYIDETKCPRLVKAIENYRKEWDDKHGIFKSQPLHNEFSHYADALRQLGVSVSPGLTVKTDKFGEEYEDDDQNVYRKYGLFPTN